MPDGVFKPKRVSEVRTYTFDFSTHLASGELLTGTPTFTVTVVEGTDPSPSSMLSGGAALDATSKKATQKLTGGVDGVLYCIECSVDTDGSNTLEATGHLLVTDEC